MRSERFQDARDQPRRYLFPRLLRFFAQLQGAVVEDDPHRPGLKNLFLPRNDALLNSFEAHLLLANLGNIDWRALLNLWAVLEYLTKYNAKAGKGSQSFKKTFANVTEAIDEFEKDGGLKDLWRTAIMKFYSRVCLVTEITPCSGAFTSACAC